MNDISLLGILAQPLAADRAGAVGDMPVPTTLCQGSPAEMGRQQGQHLAQLVRQVIARLQDSGPFVTAKPTWLPSLLWPAAARWRAKRWLRDAVRLEYPRQFARAVAIAEAADVPESFVWLAMATETGAALPLCTVGACTAAVLGPERTEFAEPAMIKNFGLASDLAGLECVRKSMPRDRFASLDVTYPPLPGCHDGINEAGLALCCNYAYPADAETKPRWPISLLCQELLEHCRTVPEAINAVAGMPRSGGAILLLTDVEGQIAALELSPHHLTVRQSTTGHLVAANHYHAARMCGLDFSTAPQSAAVKRENSDWMGRRSVARSEMLEKLIQTRSRWDLAGLWQLLTDLGQRGGGGRDTICKHPSPSQANVTLLILARRRQLWLAAGSTCKDKPAVVELDV